MGFKSFIIKPFANKIARDIRHWSLNAVAAQEKAFQSLIKSGKNTLFGKEHYFDKIHSYEAFKGLVPLRDYEGLRPYIDKIKKGEKDVLWKGQPKYFAKTSGTTSGIKYIPLTKESMPNHFNSARNALFNYYARTGNGHWLDGKDNFSLRQSRIRRNQWHFQPDVYRVLSTMKCPLGCAPINCQVTSTNCIEEWEDKLEKIVEETHDKDMRLISGIPPWVQMYYERLLDKTGKRYIKDIFPNFSVFVYGGVNFEPYRASLENLVGKQLDSIETYPASEGFIAFQDDPKEKGLLLNVDSGIFFEFVPAAEIFNAHPTRLSLKEIEVGVNYALIINNNAGLWGYNIGDTVQFISKNPYRIVVSGRIKHFISAFGEHVIGKEVETALLSASKKQGLKIVEFTVAPNVNPQEGGLPYHEWFIEFEDLPEDLETFAQSINREMVQQNIYYEDLIKGNILKPLKIQPLKKNTFRNYMKSQGKLGGQNKVPRLSNDRKIVEELILYQ